MAGLEINKIKTQCCGALRRRDVITDQAADVAVAHQRVIRLQFELAIEDGMPVEDHRLLLVMVVRFAEAPRVRQLQTDYQAVVAAHDLAMRSN